MSEQKNLSFRMAAPGDGALILAFIRALADYEKMLDQVVATPEVLEEELFQKGRARVLFALEDGREVGFALFFHNFSTFLGRAGLHLEDLFVLPERRGRGYGRAILRELARIARAEGSGRLEWNCRNWNQPSIGFYKSLGAETLDDWVSFRLTEDAMDGLTGGED